MNQLLKRDTMLTTNEGRMESMNQLLKKFALLAACAALALCFTTRPAHAQMVADGGTGEHLLFGYWSTANYMNTNISIHSTAGGDWQAFRDKMLSTSVIRDMMAPSPTVSIYGPSFNICLMPGDSWTATLSMDGLMVMDAGLM